LKALVGTLARDQAAGQGYIRARRSVLSGEDGGNA